MGFQVFTEKEVQKQILNKIKPKKTRKQGRSSSHRIQWIELNGRLVLKVRIPNSHNKDFHRSKAKHLAFSLRLNAEEYNSLIGCSMSGTDYYKLLTDEPDRI